MRITIIFLVFLLISGKGFSQKKIEQEKRIKKQEVPELALEWLEDSFEGRKKVRWYLEISDQGISYEAKFPWNEKFHSVEFDSLGNIQDVEVEIQQQELEKDTESNILSFLQSEYSEFRIQRIQRQYSGNADDLEDFFDEGELERLTIRFEIEYIAKDRSGNQAFWEGLFDQNGNLISKREVEIRIMDNLIF
ncbi:hypothetical protein E4S40_01475 [Algoriphagus kandeliae]|uniref:Uncharacterized protein n=1 Tax=Algoriphagus kandeliae TaxID=2562278 RepID=A0A4Y9R1F4_9BACT|nr:hypothetical protein [Algoriphagus kandeliae]TFV97353.1 hypothetical protein E4S40_01475 [Algoriphagus kandeliae]